MTANLQPDDELFTAEITATKPGDAPPGKPKPRIWTVFLAYLSVFVGAAVLQAIAALALVVWYVAHGWDAKQVASDLPEMVSTPAGFMALASIAQAAMFLAAFIPARLSAEPARRRLGLVSPGLPLWAYVVITIGSVVPLAVGLGLARALPDVMKTDENVQRLYQQTTWAWAVPFVLFIALVPGFVEEAFFRGYMQRRLLERWSPALAILVTTTLFALMHVVPHAILNAFIVGLWLGALAWRTGSVWPGVVSHAFLDGALNIWQIGKRRGVFPDTPPMSVTATISAVVLGCFIASVWLIARRRVPSDRPAIETSQPIELNAV